MKILQVQDHLKSGGAARAAGRWAELLGQSEGEVLQAAGDEVSSHGYLLTGKPARGWGRIAEWIRGRVDRKNRAETQLHSLLQKTQPDRIWFHNIAGGGKWGWSEEMVLIARQYAPVLWTLHDMWALGSDDQSYWDVDLDEKSRSGQEVKEERLKGSRVQWVYGESAKYPITITAPSQWLADMSKKITGQECVFLPNPIDLKIFSPGDRAVARRRWGLPEEGLVILAGADSLADPRKGFDLLREAWGSAGRHGVTLALFGRHGESRPGDRYLGNLTSDEEMVAAYQAADLYVHPARMENAPCTIQESLACGTPVLAFAVGGIPEMIESGENGYLAAETTGESLNECMNEAFTNSKKLSQMRMQCRKSAEDLWDAGRLKKMFENLHLGLKGG